MRETAKTAFHDPNPEELAAWQEALRPVRARMADRVGRTLIERIEAELRTPQP
jgi:hypothetical protein